MTSVPEADRLQPGFSPLRELPQEYRPVLRPRIVLIGTAFLIVLGVLYGVQTRHSRQESAAPKAAFQPYDVVIKGDSQDDSAPVATQSVEDLRQWAATQSLSKASDDASTGDSPAHVKLYRTKRIMLIPQGTPGRVLSERNQWKRILIVDGLYKGTTGYISQDAVGRLVTPSQKTADIH